MKLHKTICFILLFSILFSSCSNQTDELTTDEDATTAEVFSKEEAAETEIRETADTTDAPQNGETKDTPIMLENKEAIITYLRSLIMNLVSVPDELGDSCYIKLLIPNEIGDFGSNDGVGTTQHLYPNGYYLKDNIYYRNGGQLTWNAISGKEKTILYQPDSNWVMGSLYGERELNEHDLKTFYRAKSRYYFQISGSLSHEIYPSGYESMDGNIPNQQLWGEKMAAAGLWYTKLTGECFGDICGDIYVMESSDSGETYWICFDGNKPLKVSPADLTYHMTEAPETVDGDFLKEKENALYRLSFDLLVERPESENGSLDSTPFYGDYDLTWTNNLGKDILLSATNEYGTVSFQYDDRNLRTSKTNSDGETTYFTYDGAHNLSRVESGTHLLEYRYEVVYGRLSHITVDGITYTCELDHLNLHRLLDEEGNVVVEYRYENSVVSQVLGCDEEGKLIDKSDDEEFIGNLNKVYDGSGTFYDEETSWYYRCDGKYVDYVNGHFLHGRGWADFMS